MGGLSSTPPGRGNVPVLMFTARGHEVDRIVGLELGANDYVVKPFNPCEPVARVRAVLRRSVPFTPEPKAIRMGLLEVDAERREALIEGRQLRLRAKEFDLLLALAKRPGIVLSRDQLLEDVWGYRYGGSTRTVDAHVARLRHKLEGSGVAIETV
jgi:DNA-binding response OmpR family regulator